jgi:fluoroacetyl-CoA thioesterase
MIDVSLLAGIRHELRYRVPTVRTVRHLLPEANEFQTMPDVLATGYLIGLTEWACMRAVRPYLEWPRFQTVGTRVDLSHSAPTPPGLEVRIAVELVEVDGRRMAFSVCAYDDRGEIATGRHERCVIDTERFSARAAEKVNAG